ncbi:unnamed protein product [Brachionus calyciflorus]|uniref:G-protein coupled receptors family 1 profile domain-containing protein n=1 Tax=Brachionus calyciflorus TaxID=104777 RepID=A0A813X0W9_9BILA|nr:unnamed protein product [Brachionus calyciflorus]
MLNLTDDLLFEQFAKILEESGVNPIKYYEKVDFVEQVDKILIAYSCITIILGTFFNILNFGCFYRMKKRNSQNIYLGALSLSELFNLHINILVPLLIRLADNYNFSLKNYIKYFTLKIINKDYSILIMSFLNILNGYLVEVCLLAPVWIMVILASERFFCIMWPFKKNLFSTRKNAKKILFVVLICIFTWSMFKFKTAGIEYYSAFDKLPNFNRSEIKYPFLVNISTVLWAIIPEFLTLLLNLLIINQIKLTTKIHKKFYPLEHSKKITQATRVVIFLSVIFIVLISPTGILILIDLSYKTHSDQVERFDSSVKLTFDIMIARKFILMFYETNLIISFPIYLLTIKNFKEALKSLFCIERLDKLNRNDSTKIGYKTKHLISTRTKAPLSQNTKLKSDSVIQNSKHKANTKAPNKFKYKEFQLVVTLGDKISNKSSFNKITSLSSNSTCSNNSSVLVNDYFTTLSCQNCPYCSSFRKYSDKIRGNNFNSLDEGFEENGSFCDLNCEIRKLNTLDASNEKYGSNKCQMSRKFKREVIDMSVCDQNNEKSVRKYTLKKFS